MAHVNMAMTMAMALGNRRDGGGGEGDPSGRKVFASLARKN
jgi:hypothetical protein